MPIRSKNGQYSEKRANKIYEQNAVRSVRNACQVL